MATAGVMEMRVQLVLGELKGEVSWFFFFISFVKNDEIRPSMYFNHLPNNYRMTRGTKSTQFLKETTCDLF